MLRVTEKRQTTEVTRDGQEKRIGEVIKQNLRE